MNSHHNRRTEKKSIFFRYWILLITFAKPTGGLFLMEIHKKDRLYRFSLLCLNYGDSIWHTSFSEDPTDSCIHSYYPSSSFIKWRNEYNFTCSYEICCKSNCTCLLEYFCLLIEKVIYPWDGRVGNSRCLSVEIGLRNSSHSYPGCALCAQIASIIKSDHLWGSSEPTRHRFEITNYVDVDVFEEVVNPVSV